MDHPEIVRLMSEKPWNHSFLSLRVDQDAAGHENIMLRGVLVLAGLTHARSATRLMKSPRSPSSATTSTCRAHPLDLHVAGLRVRGVDEHRGRHPGHGRVVERGR